MDIVESDYMNSRFPDRQEDEVEEFTICVGCKETIYVGEDLVLNVYGMVSHDDFECLKKAVEATYVSTDGEKEE